LAGELSIIEELQAAGDHQCAEEGTCGCDFDNDDFVEVVRNSLGVDAIEAMVEVPLKAFLEAARHDALEHLSIGSDHLGQPFLTGIVITTDGPIVLASVTFG
jgi:hypothetical protein